jgi:hypothetical protein
MVASRAPRRTETAHGTCARKSSPGLTALVRTHEPCRQGRPLSQAATWVPRPDCFPIARCTLDKDERLDGFAIIE